MQEIQATPTETTACHYAVDITIPAELVDAAYDKALKEIRRSASIPGFRPGKSPVNLVKKRYAKAIQGEVTQQLVEQGFTKGLEITELQPATMPTLPEEKELEPQPGQDFNFQLEFDVAPTFELPEYKDIELTRTKSDITDEMVDGFIDDMRSRQATFDVVDQACAEGDMLKISYTSTVEEAEDDIPESARRLIACEDTWMMISDAEIFPGANEQVIGAKAEDTREVTIVFPEDYREEFLAGRTIVYTFTFHEVHSRVMPELTDDLAKMMGADTVDQLKDQIREYLGGELARMQRQSLEGQVYEYLDGTAAFDLPPRLLESEESIALRSLLREAQEGGAEDNQLLEDADKLKTEASSRAASRVKIRYLIEKIAEAEEITASDQDVIAFVERFKAQSKLSDADFQRQYDPEMVATQGRQMILGEQVVERIIELAKIVEKEPEEHVHGPNCDHDHEHGPDCDHDHDDAKADDAEKAESTDDDAKAAE